MHMRIGMFESLNRSSAEVHDCSLVAPRLVLNLRFNTEFTAEQSSGTYR